MSWKANPYDEPEEVFERWVAGLEAKIVSALRPPRQKLFPEPESVRTAVLQPLAQGERPVVVDNADLEALAYPTQPLELEITYPDLPSLPATDDKGKRRADERELSFAADGSEPAGLDDIQNSGEDEDDDTGNSIASDDDDVIHLSSSEDDDGGEEDERSGLASDSERGTEDEESLGESYGAGLSFVVFTPLASGIAQAADHVDLAVLVEFDSDGDLVPRAAKSLLDLEAAVAEDALADDDDDDDDDDVARPLRDNFEDVDDMYEDDADVLPPLDQDAQSRLSVPPVVGGPVAQPTGFVSALSLPLSRPSSLPAPTPPTVASPATVSASLVAPTASSSEVEVYELSDSDGGDRNDQLEGAARPNSSRTETGDADESMEDVADDSFAATSQAYADDEEDELADSASGEELDDEDDDGRGEFGSRAGLLYQGEPISNPVSPTPFESYAQEQASYDYSVAPPDPTQMDPDEQPNYSAQPPSSDLPGGTYALETFAQIASTTSAGEVYLQSDQTLEVDPSLLALDESAPAAALTDSIRPTATNDGFPPAPLELPILGEEAQLATDLAAITNGDLTFATLEVEVADLEQPALTEASAIRQSPRSPESSQLGGSALTSPPATIRYSLPEQEQEIVEADDFAMNAAPATVVGQNNDLPGELAASSTLSGMTQDRSIGISLEPESAHITPTAGLNPIVSPYRDGFEDSRMEVGNEAKVVGHEAASGLTTILADAVDAGPVLPPSPEPSGPNDLSYVPLADSSHSAMTDANRSSTPAVEEEQDELEDSDGSSAVEVINMQSSPVEAGLDDSESEDDESKDETGDEDEETLNAEEEKTPPPAPVVPSKTRLPLPLERKSTKEVAATHAQANPFAALTVEGMSSDDESGRSSDQGSDDEDERDPTPVPQSLSLPDTFELEQKRATPPQHTVVHPATPPTVIDRLPTQPTTTMPAAADTQEDGRPGASLMGPELLEPTLPASPDPRPAPLTAAPSVEGEALPLSPAAAVLSSPTLPSTPPSAAMEMDTPMVDRSASGASTPVDEFEAEHEAAMQPLPSAILDAEVEAAEEHTDELTLAALHSLDEVEREHDAAMQPAPALVRDHIEHEERPEASSASATSVTEMAIDEDPVLPISTPLHEPENFSLPGYVEPEDEPDLPDARAEPEPTTLITPQVPHVPEIEGSAMAEPTDTRPTTPDAEITVQPSVLSPASPSHSMNDGPDPPAQSIPAKAPDAEEQMKAPPLQAESNASAFEEIYGTDDRVLDEPLASGRGEAVEMGVAETRGRESRAEPHSTEPLAAPQADDATITEAVSSLSAAHAGASSSISVPDIAVDEPRVDEDGDKTDGGSEGEEADEDSDDEDLVLIESRRLSSSSGPKPSPPSPSRVLPERFLASDVFTEAPEELPQPPRAEANGVTEHASDARSNSRTLSYHQHGSSSCTGPSTVPRTAVVARHASTPSPQKSAVSPDRSKRASSPSRVHSSPVTRSQCVYHVLDLPGPSTSRTRFAVPYCSLSDANAIRLEDAKIVGVASPEENDRRQPLIGDDAVEIDEEVDQALTRIVGIDMVKEGHCFFLDRLPPGSSAESSARLGDSASVDDGATSSEVAVSMETEATSLSPKKRKRSDAEHSVLSPDTAVADGMSEDDAEEPPAPTQDGATEASSAKRQRLSEEPAPAPAPSRRWSFWPFSRS